MLVDTGKRKKTLVIIVVVVIGAASVLILGLWEWGGNWKHYATTVEGTHFYDAESLSTATGEIRTVRTASYAQDAGTSYVYYFDCERRLHSRRRVRDSSLLRLMKALLELAGRGYEAPSRLITPASPEEKLYQVACKGSG